MNAEATPEFIESSDAMLDEDDCDSCKI